MMVNNLLCSVFLAAALADIPPAPSTPAPSTPADCIIRNLPSVIGILHLENHNERYLNIDFKTDALENGVDACILRVKFPNGIEYTFNVPRSSNDPIIPVNGADDLDPEFNSTNVWSSNDPIIPVNGADDLDPEFNSTNVYIEKQWQSWRWQSWILRITKWDEAAFGHGIDWSKFVFNGEIEAYVVPFQTSDNVDCVTYTGLPHVVSDEEQGNKKNITGKVKASTDFQACVEYNEKKGNDPNEYLVSQSKANCADVRSCITSIDNWELGRQERFKKCRSEFPNCIQETPTFDKDSGDITFTLKNVNLNDEDPDRNKHNVRCNIENTDDQHQYRYYIGFTPKQSCTE